MLRVKHTVDDPTLVEKKLDEMCIRFASGGYHKKCIGRHRFMVNKMKRNDLLVGKIKVADVYKYLGR